VTELPKITSNFLEKLFTQFNETIIAFSPFRLSTGPERHPWAYVGQALEEIASLRLAMREKRIHLHFCHSSSRPGTTAQPPT